MKSKKNKSKNLYLQYWNVNNFSNYIFAVIAAFCIELKIINTHLFVAITLVAVISYIISIYSFSIAEFTDSEVIIYYPSRYGEKRKNIYLYNALLSVRFVSQGNRYERDRFILCFLNLETKRQLKYSLIITSKRRQLELIKFLQEKEIKIEMTDEQIERFEG